MSRFLPVKRNLWRTRQGLVSRTNFSLDRLTLFAPLWHPELSGSPFLSKDLNARTLTVYGAIWGATGRVFDGIDNYIGLGNILSFGNGLVDSPFSVLAWVNFTTDAVKGIISKWNGGTEWRFISVGTRNYRFQLYDRSAGVEPKIQSPDNQFSLATWVCLGATYDGRGGATAMTGAELYFNGAIIASPTRSNEATYVAMEPDASTLHIASYANANYLNGTIGEILVYSRALSAQEIQRHYQATKWRYL